MRRSILTLATCLLTLTLHAQAPEWIWGKSNGSSSTDNAFSIAAHSSGSTYVTGQFGGPTITFGSTTLTSAGSQDVFIAKYDASGNVLWAKSAGGPGFDGGYGIAADSAGACYVTGAFENAITFGNVTLTATGASDMFVVKYDAAGNLLWAKSAGGFLIDGGSAITVDRSGNSYVTGFYSGNFTYGTAALTNAGYEDFFIAKYDPSGNVVWAKGIGGAGKDWGTDITTDRSGNVYLTGWYNSGSLDFGGQTVTNTGQNDVFVVRLNPSGTALWAKNAGGAGSDQSLGIAVDSLGNSFITGYYTNSPISFGSHTVPNAGGEDFFLAKYDVAGNPLWARGAGGTENDLGYAVAADANGYSYVTGWFLSSSISFGSQALPNAGTWPYSDLFVTRYDPLGNVVWTKGAGEAGMDVANGIDLDGRGNCFITGTFNTTITFGPDVLHNIGGDDGFVAKISVDRTGIREAGKAADFRLFPNPVTDRLYISYQGTGKQPFQVFDGTGRLLLSGELSSGTTAIDTRQWPAGIYGVRIGGQWTSLVKR